VAKQSRRHAQPVLYPVGEVRLADSAQVMQKALAGEGRSEWLGKLPAIGRRVAERSKAPD
jgi:hypothetical protein